MDGLVDEGLDDRSAEPTVAESPPLASNNDADGNEAESIDHSLFPAVVKIFTVTCKPNYSNPWQMEHQKKARHSGFVIGKRLIITTAHGVTHSKSIRIRKHSDSSGKKYEATIVHIEHSCDLALLTVKEEKFWKGVIALQWGDIPLLQDRCAVVSYPVGGSSLCITKGVVSRLDFVTYSHSMRSLLAIQIDASINSGASGGPVFSLKGDNTVVGIGLQGSGARQNIGYAIPIAVIEQFLKGFENRKIIPFPSLGIQYQTLENPSLRSHLGLAKEQTGIYINSIAPLSDAYQQLKTGDVILTYDGHNLSDDGTIPNILRKAETGERIKHQLLTMLKESGQNANLRILRDGKEHDVSVKCDRVPVLVPLHLYDLESIELTPTYFVWSGLVFMPLSRPFLRRYYGRSWKSAAPIHLVKKATQEYKEHDVQQTIILSHVLSHTVNHGYEKYAVRMVLSVNDKAIETMSTLVEIIDNCQQRFVSIELYKNRVIVLETELARQSLAEVLKTHNIPSDRSPDLKAKQKLNQTYSDSTNIKIVAGLCVG